MNRRHKKHSFLYTTLVFLSLKILGSLAFFFIVTHTPLLEAIKPYTSVLSLAESGQIVVEQVIDGDSVMVRHGDDLLAVRLLGIDAPEKYDDCYGFEALIALQDAVLRKPVKLLTDSSQADTDYYGRHLAYLFVDETNINQWMIEEGYALEYTHDQAYAYQSVFRALQDDAYRAERGLWNRKNCIKD